jgi:DNA polymerase I-like protein with 3'-5' exonuclease and polymerase domains
MSVPEVITVDYETHPIQPRPLFPPSPVGVSIKWPGQRSQYYAFGHPSYNNCERNFARGTLQKVWDSGLPILFHNASFDLSVSYERMKLPMLPWQRVHDTMFLLFLHDPHTKSLGLKESAEEILNWPPEEQNAINDYVWENRAALNAEFGGKMGRPARVTRTKGKVDSLGVWISCVPGNIVAPYAEGDTDRTHALFRHTYNYVQRTGMGAAYDRERRLLPIFMSNERSGLRVDQAALAADLPMYEKALGRAEAGMRHYLGAPDLNFDDDAGLASAFVAANVVHADRWVTTPKSGQLSVAKDNLPPDAFVDPALASMFGYRNRLVTCMKMFMQPWLEQAQGNGGYIHTQWNQVRGERGGARTGRPSMTKPNLLNVSKSWDGRKDGYTHPDKLDLPLLPLVRKYILPDEGDDLFIHRDFDGQELRVFAHFESGELLQQYLANPDLDPHGWILNKIREITDIVPEDDRTTVKVLNFQSLYGGGINAISEKLRCSRAEAQAFKNFHDAALPGRKVLSEEIIRIVRRNEPIRTWGGRLYYCEPPSIVNGRRQTWEYKLINYLIQGSAADITKEAICRWHEGGGVGRLLLTVYDEIDLSVATHQVKEGMAALREVMDSIELDCPMRSSGKVGESWGKVAKYIDP